MKPTITALDTNRSIEPSFSEPGDHHDDPGHDGQCEEHPFGVVTLTDLGYVGHDRRHRPGGLNGHELTNW